MNGDDADEDHQDQRLQKKNLDTAPVWLVDIKIILRHIGGRIIRGKPIYKHTVKKYIHHIVEPQATHYRRNRDQYYFWRPYLFILQFYNRTPRLFLCTSDFQRNLPSFPAGDGYGP